MEDMKSTDALKAASAWLRTARAAIDKGDYEVSLYAQEMALEISLKAVLIYVNTEAPRRHDILEIFSKTVKERKGIPETIKENRVKIIDTFRSLLYFRQMGVYSYEYNIDRSEFQEKAEKYYPEVERIVELCVLSLA